MQTSDEDYNTDKNTNTKLLINEKTKCSNNKDEEEDENDSVGKKNIWIRYFGPIKDGSLRGSVLAMASITFGGGCLAFSSAIRDMGLVNGLLLFFFVALISFYTLEILTQAGIKAEIYDYNQLIEKFLGKRMVFIADINNLFLCLGVIVGYQKFIYEFAIDILSYFFVINQEDIKMIQLYIILVCFLAIQIPLTSMKKISVLQYASITGSFALIYSIVCICIKMPANFQKNNSPENPLELFEEPSLKYLVSISIFLFGFSSHNGIFQIYVELKKPSKERYTKVLKRSFLLEVILYLLISLGGFLSFLRKTEDNLLNNYEASDITILISKIALFICLHCSMAINYNIMRQSYRSFFLKDENSEFVWYKDLFLCFLTLLISNIIVYNLNSARQILGIVGGICTVIICFWNPIMLHLRVNKFSRFSISRIFAILVLVIVVILGTSSSIYSIYDYIMSIIENNKE